MTMHVDQEIFETIADLINETIKLETIRKYENQDNELEFMNMNEIDAKLSKSIKSSIFI
jgi:hypothetical protein